MVETALDRDRIARPYRSQRFARRMGIMPPLETGRPVTMVKAYGLSEVEARKPLPIMRMIGEKEIIWVTTPGERLLRELRVSPMVYDGVVLVYKPGNGGNERYGLVLRPTDSQRNRKLHSPAIYVRELSQAEYDAMGPDVKIQILNQSNLAPEPGGEMVQ